MTTKDKILNYLMEKQSATGKDLTDYFGISRQAVNKHLKPLIQESKVIKEGSTRGVVYKYHRDKKRAKFIKSFSKTYLLTGLEENKDVFVEEKKSIVGTEVVFNISKKSKKKLDEIFTQFAPEEFDFRFERTRVKVKLIGKNYISRSEAKRLLFGLHKFKEIILDFDGVKTIGQSFADEIFRVFKNEHPEIVISIENLSLTLKSMINHVVDDNI